MKDRILVLDERRPFTNKALVQTVVPSACLYYEDAPSGETWYVVRNGPSGMPLGDLSRSPKAAWASAVVHYAVWACRGKKIN